MLDAPHGFFTRNGGVSEGLYHSMNCGLGSDDAETHVIENRARAAAVLRVAPENLVTLYQIHSNKAVTLTRPWAPKETPQADAMVTRQTGLALGILTADCAPVILADTKNGVIGAAHAGWKGALSGIIEVTVEAMIALGAGRSIIAAAIGPCISQRNYEVGPEFKSRFCEDNKANDNFFTPSLISERADYWHFDLPGFAAHRLRACGIRRIDDRPACTYAQNDRFFSYRRSTHRREPDYGRNLSAIVLDAP